MGYLILVLGISGQLEVPAPGGDNLVHKGHTARFQSTVELCPRIPAALLKPDTCTQTH